MKHFNILLFAIVFIPDLISQTFYPDASLRLQPVWSRVADVFGEAGSVESAEFSPNGKFIVSGTKFDNSVVMWRTSDGQELWRKYAAQEIERVGWSADGKYVASCSEDFLVQVWNAETGELVKEIPHEQGIDGLIWSNTSSLLVTGEEVTKEKRGGETIDHGWLRVFQMPEGKLIHKVDHGHTINEVVFSKDDKYLLSAGHGSVKVWKTEDMSLLQELRTEQFFKFVSADFSPDGKYLAASGYGGLVFIWDWQSGKLAKQFNYRGRKVETVAWHPNGDYLVTAGHGPYINIFRTSDIFSKGKEVPAAAQVFANDGAEYIDFNTDGSFLISAHQDGVIRLWVWMGEDALLNNKRHSWVKKQQKAATETKQ